ncbi:retinoid- and fatty-acid binding glycoprotein apolipophorin [Xylocopa sonorina]|uniref:retinoid- and fatty-acid binding glycoprotein apolipophorin n=1 Tax=Xylocopa sonorina TaxID=1818115 RepID=UPI00403B07CC
MQDSGSKTMTETDVMGSCLTELNFHKDDDWLVVNKNRNLAQCAYRENVNQGLLYGNVDTATGLKSAPLLDSTQNIEQRFKQGVLNRAHSKEVYKLNPFRNGDAGAKTTVETTLMLKGNKADNPTAPVSLPKSLIFEAPHPVLKSSPEAISDALKAAKAEAAGSVTPDAAEKVAELVKVLKLSNKDDIMSVYRSIDKSDQKLFLDALFRAASGEAAEVGVELVKKKELTDVQALLFYASLGLVSHVNLPSVTTVLTLLDQPNLPRIGYLGVGHVVGKYCQAHSCENVAEVKQAVHKIRGKVGNGKAKTREQENLIISALKALGNAAFLDDATLQKVANIVADKNVRNRVRVAAIEILPNRCSMKWKNILFKVLADLQEDSEVRIKTYLALVACPCPHVASQLKETLDKEPVNQVGSFIQSHLRNLRASTDPSKLNAQNQLGQIKPRTKYPEDFRKYSFNNELSYKVGSFGMGATIEDNVIYSQNSFVPRSANLNMTVELFGRNFNFLELDARVENLDRVIERYFGPKGKVWGIKKDINQVSASAAEGRKLGEYIKERYQKALRTKRDVKQGELNRFAKNVHLRDNEVDQDLDLDLSVKLFGVELAYLTYQGDNSKLNIENVIDKMFRQLEKGFDLAKNLNFDLENYLQFLDVELVYPTGLGSALNLGLTGTSALRLKTHGKLDIQGILANPQNANFRVALEPSVSVRITGNMVVQAPGAEAGMKVISTLHTATSTDLTVSMLDGNGVDVSLGIPKKKQEVVNISSKILLSSGGKGDKYVPAKLGKGKQYSDCFDQFNSILGLTICGKLSFPYEDLASVEEKPLFPLSGPAEFSVTLENNDVTNYHFRLYLNTEDPSKRSFEILLDTPNSKTNRRLAFTMEAGLKPNAYAKVVLDSPIKKASLDVQLKNNAEERTISVTLHHDQIEYYGRIGLLTSGSKYKVVLEYKVPDHIDRLANVKTGPSSGQQYKVTGTVDVLDHEGGVKYVMDKVALMVGDQKLITVDGSLAWKPWSVNLDANLEYGGKSLALKLNGELVNDKNYKLTVSAMPSTDPNIGFNLSWEYKRGPHELEHCLVFIHGPDPNSETNRLTLKEKVVFKLPTADDKQLLVSGSSELTYPVVNLKLKFDGKLTDKLVDVDAEFNYEKFKAGAELSAKRDLEKPGEYEVELEVDLMQNSVELKSKRTVVDEQKSKYSNSLVLTPGGKYEAVVTVLNDINKNSINFQADGDINLNGKKVKVDTSLEANSHTINSRLFLKADGVKYIEFALKNKRSPNPTGTLSLSLRNYLSVVGQYSYQNKKGSANLNIDIPRLNRKIKGTVNLAITGSEHVGNMELLYDAEKDPSKRIKLSTITDLTKGSIDSKNVLEVLTYKLELNAKGKMQGNLNDGQLQLEVDTTLPGGQYIVYKINRNVAKKDRKHDAQMNAELMYQKQKGGPSAKLSYIATISYESLASTFNYDGKMHFVNVDGQDVQLALQAKNLEQAENKKLMEGGLQLTGSSMPKKFELQLGLNRGDTGATVTAKSALGNDFSLTGNANLEKGNQLDKPEKLSCTVDLKLPSDKLRNVKVELTSSALEVEKKDLLESTDTLKITYNDDKTINVEAYLKLAGLMKADLEPSEGVGKIALNILDLAPVKVAGNYKYDPSGAKKKGQANLKASYGDKELSLKTDSEEQPTMTVVNLKAKGNLNLQKLRDLDLQLTYKCYKEDNKVTVDSDVTADGKKYTLNGEMQVQESNSLIHLTATCPKGKTELLSKMQKLGEKEYKAEWKVDTPNGFAVADAHVDLESVDNFMITVNFDSDKIKQRKIHAEIANKPTLKTGKRILVTVTSDGQNIVTGSTSYKKRDEDGKVVVEGNGNLKIGDNSRSSSFKYTRQQLTREKDGEIGVAMVLNVNFGPSAIVGELKLTNKELHVFNSYCEQNKDCAQFKLQSILDQRPRTSLKHQLTVEVDVKKFNVPAEFGLKTSTELRNPVIDHTTNLYLHTNKHKSEYTYQLYVHPKESASILTLPSRELAAILSYDLPKTKQTGAYKVDLSLYLDKKNKPAEKTSLSASGDINVDKNSLYLSGETKFTYPTQTKDMLVKGSVQYGGKNLLDASLDLDVFAKKSQKIVLVANVKRQDIPDGCNLTSLIEVNSRGQQLKLDLKSHLTASSTQIGAGSFFTYNDANQKPRTMGFLGSADLKHVSLLLTLPDKQLLKDDWKMDFSKDVQKINREVSILGMAPQVTKITANDFNRLKIEQYWKDTPENKVTLNGQVVLGQLADIHVDSHKGGEKKNLFRALVHLDEKQFLKPDFNYNKDNVAEVMENGKKRYEEIEKKVKELNEYITEQTKAKCKDLQDHLKKAQPNVKPLVDYYKGELSKMKAELNADEALKDLQETLLATVNKYFGVLIESIESTVKQMAEDMQKLEKTVKELLTHLQEASQNVYNSLKESYGKIFHQLVELFDHVIQVVKLYVMVFLDLINKHQKEILDAMNAVSGVTEDFARIILKGLEQLKQNLNEFTTMLGNQLKALPIYEAAKEKWEELKKFETPQLVLGVLEDICRVLKANVPIEQIRELLDSMCQYIMKHVKREKVDEMSELKNIYKQLINVIQMVLGQLKQKSTFDAMLNLAHISAPLDLSFLSQFPGIVSLKVSVLNLLRNRELPSPLDLYYAYRPTLHLSDLVPPFTMSAVLTEGGHFFTFDGRHLTMPGTCTYILAQDMEDGNFSVVANLNNGALVSITVTEPTESITLKNNGNLLVNNKPADYPANTANLHAFLVQPFHNINSDYGVRVVCANKGSMICAVYVSGFYLGKVRGILGDGNNEPYDDFTLPSGKITENAAEFGNAYKVKPDCPAATVVEHADRAPVCTEYFTGENSPLSSCFKYVNPAHYRHACDHAVAANTPSGPCIIAGAYHYACYAQGLMSTSLPSGCASCKVGANKIEIGDTFSVKVPKKEADVIFVVEQQTPNDKVFKEMITPLMSEVREELKQHGITDVHVGLIGYSEQTKWPQHYTLNGNDNIDGEVKNMKFYEKKPEVTWEEAREGELSKKIDYVRQKLDIELGTFKLTDAYETAVKYPFRAGAAKVVIGVIANPCVKSSLPISLQQVRLLLGHKMYRDLGLTYYHISYPGPLYVSGKPQTNIVGYDADSAYTFADSKKKPLSGSSDMKSNLSPTVNDVCADFAVLSGGATFSLDNFLDAKPNQKKQFVQVAAKRIADGLANLELEKDCACNYMYGFTGRTRCKIVGRKEAPRPATKGAAKG